MNGGARGWERERDGELAAFEGDFALEFADVERIGEIEDANVRLVEAGDMNLRAGDSGGAEPIGIRDVGVCVMQGDSLNDADVVVAVERGEGDGVGAVEELL